MPLAFGTGKITPVASTGLNENDTYRIERSLRFDSAYLNRTPSSATNQKTYTFNFWIKRSQIAIGTDVEIFSALYASTNSRYAYIAFEADDTLSFFSGVYSTGASTTISYQYRTTQVFRDPSAWYMITVSVDTTNATASERVKLYVNGVRVTSFSTATQPSLNQNGYWNSPQFHGIGTFNGSSGMFPGYLAEINFIDGQALDPSSFGETDTITGRWKAKAYSGTYGTNGFYLKFSDNSSLTTTSNVGIGKDFSGNANYWATNGISITAGTGNDSLVDSPTNYGSDSGLGGEVRGNYCTLNPINASSVFSFVNGNLDFSATATSTATYYIHGSLGVSYGKWYWEVTPSNVGTGPNITIGIRSALVSTLTAAQGIFGDGFGYNAGGSKWDNSGNTSYGASWTNNDVIGVTLNLDSGTIEFYKNGVSQGTAFTGISGTFVPSITIGVSGVSRTIAGSINFGQRPFTYAAPSGYRCLCATNLPTPSIKKPNIAMDVVTYTGTGSTRSISGLNFSPDLLWVKARSTTHWHNLIDIIRGTNARLSSNSTNAEDTGSAGGATPLLDSFNFDGWTYGNGNQNTNENGTTYVAWSWDAGSTTSTNTSGSITSTVRANPQAGFSIVSFTGTGANTTVGHGLGVAPKMIIIKNRNNAGYNWRVYHSSLTTGSSYLSLNLTDASTSSTTIFTSTPSSSVFNIGSDNSVNGNSHLMISYCFAEIEGYSKFGSYTGNGSADGPFVWCGFRPRWVMYKRTDSTENWVILDSTRDTFNVSGGQLVPNSSSAEGTGSANLDIISNGFKMRSSTAGGNASNATYIFSAFAESPFKYARAR